MAVSNLSWQYAFIPHGEGLHGLDGIVGGAGVAEIIESIRLISRNRSWF